jgi:hypothetical protein
MLNEVPLEYFCNVDHEGRRRDFEERPELCTGTVEYIAPQEYMVSFFYRCIYQNDTTKEHITLKGLRLAAGGC